MSVAATVQPQATIKQLFGIGFPQLILLSGVDQNGVQFGVDPTTGNGVDAAIGSIGLFSDGTTGKLYVKTGVATTAWTLK